MIWWRSWYCKNGFLILNKVRKFKITAWSTANGQWKISDFIPKINEKSKFENRIWSPNITDSKNIFFGWPWIFEKFQKEFFVGISTLKNIQKTPLILFEIKFRFRDTNFQKFLNCNSKFMNRVLYSKIFRIS